MEAIVGMLIPIIGIIAGVLLAYAGQVHDHRRREMLHDERMRALELGIELPPWPEEAGRGDPYGNLKAAIVLMFIGVAFLLGAGTTEEEGMLIPTFLFFGLGFAFLLIHLMVPKAGLKKKNTTEPMRYSTPPVPVAPVRRDIPSSALSRTDSPDTE